jgi:hypothetical protein
VVEVCIDCAWNHLVRAFTAGRMYATNGNGVQRERRGRA